MSHSYSDGKTINPSSNQEFSEALSENEHAVIASNVTLSYTRHDPGGLEEDPYADITIESSGPAPVWKYRAGTKIHGWKRMRIPWPAV